MRVNINQLIKFCGIRTVPAAETKSIGLQADARVSWFLQRHLDNFIVTRQLSSIYRDLVPSRQITVTQDLSSTYRDWQKTRHLDTPPAAGQAPANSLNRRAVSTNSMKCAH